MRALLLLLPALLPLLPARAAEKSPAKGFEKFALLRERNVFDPERRAPVRSAPAAANPAPASTSRRPAAVLLTGTMATEKKTLAFFTSGQADLNQILPVGRSIAGFTVASISNGIVEVERGGKRTALAVGDQLPIENAAPPEPPPDASALPAAPGTAGNAPAAAPGAPGAPAAAPSAPPSASEMMRRMMERRQKETSR